MKSDCVLCHSRRVCGRNIGVDRRKDRGAVEGGPRRRRAVVGDLSLEHRQEAGAVRRVAVQPAGISQFGLSAGEESRIVQ